MSTLFFATETAVPRLVMETSETYGPAIQLFSKSGKYIEITVLDDRPTIQFRGGKGRFVLSLFWAGKLLSLQSYRSDGTVAAEWRGEAPEGSWDGPDPEPNP